MSTATPPTNGRVPRASGSGRSLRLWGVLLLLLFLLTSVVGGSLALESSFLPLTLASHVGLAVVTLGLAVYGAAVLGRPYRALSKGLVGLAGLSALVATIAGTVFLLWGQSNPALYTMEAFAGIGIAASLLLIVFGGESGKRVPATGVP
jgi:hypothetical protein